MTNRVSGVVGFAAADLAAAIPGPPFRKTGAGWLGASVQAASPLQAAIRANASPCCRPRRMSRPRNSALVLIRQCRAKQHHALGHRSVQRLHHVVLEKLAAQEPAHGRIGLPSSSYALCAIIAFTVEMLLAGTGIREEVAYHRRTATQNTSR